jgi:hypothetical protein
MRANPARRVFPNLARRGTPEENPDVAEVVRREMEEAGLKVYNLPRSDYGEVPCYLVRFVHGKRVRRPGI